VRVLVSALALSGATLGQAAGADVLVGFAAPLTGDLGWHGEMAEQALRLGVDDLNKAGGVLGERIEMLSVDDFADPDQAVAAARRLVGAGADVVIGHPASGAAIPASAIYDQAGIPFISPAASHPQLTGQGFAHVFRVVGRDDQQTEMAADYLAERFGGGGIAILHDGQTFGGGIAEQTKRRLASHGVDVAMYAAVEPGQADYLSVVQDMRSAGVEVVYYGGYAAEAALIIRQARDFGYELRLVSGDNLNSQYFWQVAGDAAEGALFTSFPDALDLPAAADFVHRFRSEHLEPESIAVYSYAALQVWAQAVEQAGTVDGGAVAATMQNGKFDTALGSISFDGKGDVAGYDTYAWYVWRAGDYVLLENAAARE
jgi:branched-chain amino acid transport system substrate-binding protein